MTEDDIPEWTEADWAAAIRRSDRTRMALGEFQPGDIELLTKFLRITPDEMRQALGAFSPIEMPEMDRTIRSGGILHEMLRRLLLIAAREPGAFRRALILPRESPAAPNTP